MSIRASKNYRYTFSCLDIFSKFGWFVPVKRKEARDTLGALKKVPNYNLRLKPVAKRNRFDFPEYLVSDKGGEFRSELEEEYLKESGVTHKTTQSYTPQPNIENLSGQLRAMTRANFIKTY